MGVWGFVLEPRQLVVARAQHSVPLSPRIRIVAFSDVHLGSLHVDEARLATVVDVIAAQEPDLVLFLGDLVATRSLGAPEPDPHSLVETLSRLRAPLGVFAVLGNHEHWFDAPAVQRELGRAGMTVLSNRAVELDTDPPLWLVGVDDEFTDHDRIPEAFASVPDGVACLVATHSPDVFPELPDRPSLTLAGHTHGGQVALPFVGALVTPSRYGRRYARGAFTEGRRQMHVTSGIGTSILPVRFLVPPEILVIDLEPAR